MHNTSLCLLNSTRCFKSQNVLYGTNSVFFFEIKKIIGQSFWFVTWCSLWRCEVHGVNERRDEILEVYNACGLTTDHKYTTAILCKASTLMIASCVVRFCVKKLQCQYHKDLVNVRMPEQARKGGTPDEVKGRWQQELDDLPGPREFETAENVVID